MTTFLLSQGVVKGWHQSLPCRAIRGMWLLSAEQRHCPATATFAHTGQQGSSNSMSACRYTNTTACISKISFIDGAKGILRYRGYPIEQLAEKANYSEVQSCH